jgi:hypothetical protein
MKKMITIALSLMMSGCVTMVDSKATMVETKVTAFHEFDEPLKNLKYSIMATPEQESSLEYRNYEKLIKTQLEKKGLIETSFMDADLAFSISYGINDGVTTTKTAPIIGQIGSGGSTTTGTLNTYGNTSTFRSNTSTIPVYGVVGTRSKTETNYTRFLFLNIIDVKKSTGNKIARVYEGQAISTGPNNQLNTVLPAMIRSIFLEFPGESGKTELISGKIDQ